MTILIVNAVEWGPEHRDANFPKDVSRWIEDAVGGEPERFRVWIAQSGDPAPSDPGEAVIVSGSAASVYEELPWIERLAGAVRGWAARGTPILGICFGHQLLAHAMGGKVIKHPGGWELGTTEVEIRAAGASDPLFEGLPSRIRVMESHQDIVIDPPPGAEVLASTAHCACQAMRIGENVRSVQFHPEYTVERMRFLIGPRRPRLEAAGVDVESVLAGLEPTPAGPKILANFRRHFIEGKTSATLGAAQ
jgi:GMP synthase (glutamine-hydrolysing)